MINDALKTAVDWELCDCLLRNMCFELRTSKHRKLIKKTKLETNGDRHFADRCSIAQTISDCITLKQSRNNANETEPLLNLILSVKWWPSTIEQSLQSLPTSQSLCMEYSTSKGVSHNRSFEWPVKIINRKSLLRRNEKLWPPFAEHSTQGGRPYTPVEFRLLVTIRSKLGD